MTLKSVFADLHIHIGRTEGGLPVKITGARNLTFDNIVQEATHRKGIRMIGIIDAHSPPVQEEIARNLDEGRYETLSGGGIRYRDTTAILGVEIEVKGAGRGVAHLLAYFPDLDVMRTFSGWMSRHVKNMQLSTQRFHGDLRELEGKVADLGGLLVPAHVFTPFKSVYGSAVDRMSDLLDPDQLAGVELGLSSDSTMADRISELEGFTFLTNSDAHSLPKIGREYNELLISEPCFHELKRALHRQEGRRVLANYGLDPKLGKYHRTRCLNCEELLSPTESGRCEYCGSTKMVRGVADRIDQLADRPTHHPDHRAPYIYQVPLEFIPKLGPKTLQKLLSRFGTEMEILHRASLADIAELAGASVATHIRLARERRLEFEEGGGGSYGRIRSVGKDQGVSGDSSV
ncbi:endonuclease Q family protein [Kroppenstedtia eburnea]|uniref:endonuclease Q family protein n=1 Tax=Kroppenstedtia eburnea TaxID=714067 RepID=UPI00020C7210|nr:YqxK like protein [Desmospora sp. 8437]